MAGLDSYVKFLSHFNGNNGAKEIVDSGATGHVVTQVGTAILSIAQKKFGSTSLLLDGNSDYVSVAYGADLNWGTADYTVDFWVRFAAVNYFQVMFVKANGTSSPIRFSWNGSTAWNLEVAVGMGTSTTFNDTLSINTWYHIALVKTSGTYKLFRNGTQVGSNWANASTIDASVPIYIGVNWDAASDGWLGGYIDEFRVSNTARWTTTFSVPTSAYTSDANTQLLLHMESMDVSSTTVPKIPTFVGTAQISTARGKFNQSLLLDGNSDYVTVPDSADFFFDTGDFTIDFWIWLNVDQSWLIGQGSSGNKWGFNYSQSQGKVFVFSSADGGSSYLFEGYIAWTPSINTWYHFALVRNGTGTGCLTIYINGIGTVLTKDTGNWNASFVDAPNELFIGRNSASADTYLAGYIDELRISKGIARWTSNFTPPTSEYTRGGGSRVIII